MANPNGTATSELSSTHEADHGKLQVGKNNHKALFCESADETSGLLAHGFSGGGLYLLTAP